MVQTRTGLTHPRNISPTLPSCEHRLRQTEEGPEATGAVEQPEVCEKACTGNYRLPFPNVLHLRTRTALDDNGS
jgi:hypothetical protein